MGMIVSVEAAYRAAFEDFSSKAERVQRLAEHPGSNREEFERALLDLEKAQLAYEHARDALVRSLLPASQQATALRDDHRADVRTIAELLWERAGRPTGTAEEDWLRAEAIVQSAMAASCA
jgi:phosphosulfolactate phosphohydrolase-like enzyme